MAIETPNSNGEEKKSIPPEKSSTESKKSEDDDVLIEDEPEMDKIEPNNMVNESKNAEKVTEKPFPSPELPPKSEEKSSNPKKKPTIKEKLKNAVTEIKKKGADPPPDPIETEIKPPNLETIDLEKIVIQNESKTPEPTEEELEQLKSESSSTTPIEHPNKDHIKSNIITIKVKIGEHIKENTVDANINEFCVVCRGYDKKEKRYCYRYLDNLTIMQAHRFEKFLNKHGCMCGEQIDIIITPKSVLDEINKLYPVNPRRFEEKFIDFYFKKINFPAISLMNDP